MAVVERIEAVKIIYDDKSRIFFNFFAELYRLIGLYVEEKPLEDDHNVVEGRRENSRSISLCISYSYAGESEDIFYIDPARLGQWDMSRSDGQLPESVKAVMTGIREWLQSREVQFPCDLVEQILPIYIKHNVLKGAMQLQYYRMKTEIHQETESIFGKVLADLESIEEESEYLTYAKIYCKQKANLACYFQVEKPLCHAISALVRECDALIEAHPDFSNARVLKGMVCERSTDGLKLAIDSYKEALGEIGDEIYASHIYYWVGLLYEKFGDSHSEAVYAYERSSTLQKKYRNIYKMGFMAEKEEDYQRAVACYRECVELLESKIRTAMDPLEIEYYFKTGVLVCFHSQRYLEDYDLAIQYGRKMLDFYNKEFTVSPNSHFQYYYGPDAETYQEVSKKRLKCRRLYECLAIAYRENGDEEESMRYWKLSEQF